MNKHLLDLGRPTVHSLRGDHEAHMRAIATAACETTAAAYEGVDVDHLDRTEHDTRRGTGRHSPLIGGVHVSTIAYRLDMEVESDPIVRALRAHVAA